MSVPFFGEKISRYGMNPDTFKQQATKRDVPQD